MNLTRRMLEETGHKRSIALAQHSKPGKAKLQYLSRDAYSIGKITREIEIKVRIGVCSGGGRAG